MQKSDLTDLEIETQDLKLRLARHGNAKETITAVHEIITQTQNVSESPPIAEKLPDEDGYIFKSPMVGTFYRKPSPDDAAFVSVGDQIKTGSVLCIIEAMKVMNEIQSDKSGEIVDILVDDSVSVEYGQPLFKIRI